MGSSLADTVVFSSKEEKMNFSILALVLIAVVVTANANILNKSGSLVMPEVREMLGKQTMKYFACLIGCNVSCHDHCPYKGQWSDYSGGHIKPCVEKCEEFWPL